MKIIKYFLWVVVAVTVIVGFGLYLMFRLEVTQARFESYAEVASVPNIFEAGWIPSWIPKSATDIDESHDIDTNEAWLVFSFAKGDDFYSRCREITNSNFTRPREARAKRFPSFVANAITEIYNNKALRFFRCDNDDDRFLAIDESQSRAYVWMTPR